MDDERKTGPFDRLRRLAEERLRLEDQKLVSASDADLWALTHELQVHQIEFELQNDELQRAKTDAEEALVKYADLYDFAPVGYFAFDERSRILKVNLAAAELLGEARARLVGASFLPFIALESRDVFQGLFLRSLDTKTKQSVEITLLRDGKARFFALVEAVAVETTDEHPVEWRATITDISRRKEAEEALRRAHGELERRVDQRTTELRATNDALKAEIGERMRVEGELREAREESERRAAELQSFVSSMAEGAALLDAQGGVAVMNDAGIAILEAPDGESFEGWLERYERYTLDGERFPTEEAATFRALRGETVKDQRVRMVTPWGKEVTLSVSSAPVRDSNGRVIGASTVFRDAGERVELERQREELLEREHHIAEILQGALVPVQREYCIRGCRVAVKYEPALREAEVGGDFYDVFELSERRLAIVIGDVAGKGLSAAIRVASVRYAMRSYAYLGINPAQVMTLTNEALCKERDDGSGMLTAIFAVVDTRTRVMTYAAAGHEPPFVRGVDGNVLLLDHVGRALGVMGDFEYEQTTRVLDPGEMVIMFTDGINEAMCKNHEFFDEDGVIRYVVSCPNCTPSQMALGLLDAAKSHAGGELQDDAAIVVFELEDGVGEGDRE